jgi:hypothetical protein
MMIKNSDAADYKAIKGFRNGNSPTFFALAAFLRLTGSLPNAKRKTPAIARWGSKGVPMGFGGWI